MKYFFSTLQNASVSLVGVGCKLVQFVVYCVRLSWCQLTLKKIQLFQRRYMSWRQLVVFICLKLGQYADQELLKSLFQIKTPDLSLNIYWSKCMTSRVCSKSKEKKAKRKNSVKKIDQQGKKITVQRKRKQRRRNMDPESNPVYLHMQETPWPLHHSDTHDLNQ